MIVCFMLLYVHMLQCSKCKQLKSESEFYKSSQRKSWYRACCKECCKTIYKRNKDKDKEYRIKNSDKIKKYSSEWRKNNKEYYSFMTIYNCIKKRCNNETDKSYNRYWYRWIKCLRNTFDEFKRDMYESYLEHINSYWMWIKNTQIDRINNDWDYCKENCRWVTAKENNHYNHIK